MNTKAILALIVGLVLILVLARARGGAEGALDHRTLQLRVREGAGAQVPPELAEAMKGWPRVTPPREGEVALGRLLFFDPLLSQNNQISCASCHHPDLGFSDGRRLSTGVSGVELPRSAPSLWNVAYRTSLTWDGRAASLTNQMLDGPLFHPDEMAEDPVALLAELKGNAEYGRLFAEQYGEVTLENMASAIAAFQQTLISQDSAFDRYAAGDFYALTGAQRRGFEVFRGSETNCIQCHELPTFTTEEFKVIGVNDGFLPFDRGRGAITGRVEEEGAFAVPTLRNVALSAPYMHNGIEPGLTEAISFYLNGGGDNLNVPNSRLDPDLHSFNLPTRQLRDLEMFLLALTDESALPAIPEALPSGLALPAPRENPARAIVEAAAALPRGEPRTHPVAAGESIQAAIDIAQPGDTVTIAPGRYFETLEIDVSDLRVEGAGVVLVGRAFTPTAIIIRNQNVTLVGLEVTGFRGYTLDVQGARGTRLEGVILNGQTVTATLGE